MLRPVVDVCAALVGGAVTFPVSRLLPFPLRPAYGSRPGFARRNPLAIRRYERSLRGGAGELPRGDTSTSNWGDRAAVSLNNCTARRRRAASNFPATWAAFAESMKSPLPSL